MQRAISGDWVEWKPEIAPQATVMNMIGQIGVPFGCMLVKLISGMVYPFAKSMVPTPTAIKIKQKPKNG